MSMQYGVANDINACQQTQGLCQSFRHIVLQQSCSNCQDTDRCHNRCNNSDDTQQWQRLVCLTWSDCQAGLQHEGFVVVGLLGAALAGAQEKAPGRAGSHAAALAASEPAQPAELPAIQFQRLSRPSFS